MGYKGRALNSDETIPCFLLHEDSSAADLTLSKLPEWSCQILTAGWAWGWPGVGCYGMAPIPIQICHRN